MSQEENNINLNAYFSAIESFECVECLFRHDRVNFREIAEELFNCYSKVENIISLENTASPYVVDLFQLKWHILKMTDVIKNKLKRQHEIDNTYPQKIATKLTSPKIHKIDIKQKAMNIVQNTVEIPRSNGLEDIAGLWETKKILKSLVLLPQSQPQLFVNRKLCNSILLFGPPGTGKTQLVHALASEANANLHSVSVSDMLSPLVGQTEKNLQVLFDHIRNSQTFSILFIDEVDGFCRTRNDSEQEHSRRMKTELMCQMSKLEDKTNLFLICATNCPWDLDTAFLRRFQQRMYISLPTIAERYELLQLFTKNMKLKSNSDYWDKLVHKTEGFSGSDLSDLVRHAINIPIMELEDVKIWKLNDDGYYEPVVNAEDFNLEDIICCELSDLPPCSVKARPIQLMDFLNSLDNITSTVSKSDLQKYEGFNSK